MENAAAESPLTERVLTRFKDSQVVLINDYKKVFNRSKQDFALQKHTPKLILAIKRKPFLYEGSYQCQSFGYKNFFYTTPMLGCEFNCEYCYLQGMYPSANLVLFVNHDDFLGSARGFLRESVSKADPLYVSTSYDTDILPLEKTTWYAKDWIGLADEEPNLRIEIRTKSAAYGSIKNFKPNKRVILSWSLSPPSIATRYEHGAPSFHRRLQAIKKAVFDGWRVRICFDPVLPSQNLEKSYGTAIRELFETVEPGQIADVALGPFRMGKTFFTRIKKNRPASELFYQDLEIGSDLAVQFAISKLAKFLPEEKVVLWKPQS